MQGKTILVTGATGFVGGALVRRLLVRGEGRLRALVRDRQRAVECGLPHEVLVEGGLGDRDALGRAAAGVDLVFHVAGAVAALSRREFFASNAAGTAALMDAVLAVAAPEARVIHVSSLAAAGPSRGGEASARPPAQCAPISCYGQSKLQGEVHVHALGDRRPWLILRPPIIYGAGDAATRLLFRQAAGPVIAVPWTRRPLSIIHIDDVVEVLLAAGTADARGHVLPIDGPERTDTDGLNRAIATALGRRARLLRVPLTALWPVAAALDLVARLRCRPSVLGRDKLSDLRAVGWVADPEPAREVLGFRPQVGLAEGLAQVAAAEGIV